MVLMLKQLIPTSTFRLVQLTLALAKRQENTPKYLLGKLHTAVIPRFPDMSQGLFFRSFFHLTTLK